MDPLQSYVAENRERWLAELSEFLRIPSISTLPDHAGEVRREYFGSGYFRQTIGKRRKGRITFAAACDSQVRDTSSSGRSSPPE